MTTILVALDVPTPTGVDAGTPGTLYWTPTKRRNVGGHVVLPAPFSTTLVDGKASVPVAPTSPDWCWQVRENTRVRHTRYVAVPDSAETVLYTDLVDVDPATLEPSEASIPAWEAAVAEVGAIRDEVAATAGSIGVTATASPDYPDALRITYPAYQSPAPFVVRIPIGQ